jgi:hypothetical protein
MFYNLFQEEKQVKFNFLRFFFLFFIFISFGGKNLYSDFVMPISADLDYYNLNVGYEFSGDYLTLFGTKENLERIAITITGPERNYLINKREKALNLWIKRSTRIFENAPSYHASWISDDIKRERDLIDFYDLESKSFFYKDEQSDFVEYFLKDMYEKKGLYSESELTNNTNNNLFKVNLFLPNNAATGVYLLNVISFDKKDNIDGKVLMSFSIIHSDFNHFIYHMNKESPKLYAFFLIVFAFLSVGIIRYFY